MSGTGAFEPVEAETTPQQLYSESPNNVKSPASAASAAAADPHEQPTQETPNKKKRSGRKKKRTRRKSFAVLPEESHEEMPAVDLESQRPGFYLQGEDESSTSDDSRVLLDHR